MYLWFLQKYSEKKNYSLKENIEQLKKLMVGVGCPESTEADNDDAGGLQSVFDMEQAKNVATYVHHGSVVLSMLYSIILLSVCHIPGNSLFTKVLKYFCSMTTNITFLAHFQYFNLLEYTHYSPVICCCRLFQHYKLYEVFLHGGRDEQAVCMNVSSNVFWASLLFFAQLELENVAIANALQLEVARRRASCTMHAQQNCYFPSYDQTSDFATRFSDRLCPKREQ